MEKKLENKKIEENKSLLSIFYVYIMFRLDKPKGVYRYYSEELDLELIFDYEPFYVGKGKNFRKNDHFAPGRLEKETNRIKKGIIKKQIKLGFGRREVVKIYINKMIELEAFDLEKNLIKTIGRRDKGLGPLANMTDGGEGESGRVMSQEQKDKISKAVYINNGMRGKHHTPETLQQMRENSNPLKGINHPNFGKKGELSLNWGLKRTAAQIEKNRLIKIEYYKTHKVSQITKDKTGKKVRGKNNGTNKYYYFLYKDGIRLFESYSLVEISEKFNLKYSMIRKISANGNKYKKYRVCRVNYEENKIEDFIYSEKEKIIEKFKEYTIINPSGKIFKTKNLAEFCRKNNLNIGNMYSVAKGKKESHKNWTSPYSKENKNG